MAATGPKLINPGDGDPSLSAPFVPLGEVGTTIEYSAELIDLIRAEVVGALLSLPYGGLEIAGVLFGKRTGRTVYLEARRTIECEHAAGPSFHLSKRDGEQLERLLIESQSDPELHGLEVLGWYVSHTRRPAGLAPGDADVFDRFFPEARQLTGVIQPAATGQAQFGWFLRKLDGSVDRQRPTYEFTARPSAAPPSSAPQPPDERGILIPLRGSRRDELPHVRERDGSVEVPPAWHGEVPTPAPAEAVTPRRSSLPALMAAGLIMLTMAGSAVWWMRMRPQPALPPLHVIDTGTQLRIDWDPHATLVQQALGGVLQIGDPSGAPVRIGLSKDMLQTGSVLYNRPSSKVEIHLQLKDPKGAVSESMVYFIGRELEPKNPAEDASAKIVQPLPESPSVRQPEPAEVRPTASDNGSAERASRVAANTPAFKPPVIAKSAPPPEPALVEAPRISIPQVQSSAPPLMGSLRADAALPPPAVTETATTRPQPASGRLIWTGDLRKGSVLRVDSRGASAGSLNGKLPARPVKVSVHSAELLDGAIAIYTADPNSTRGAEAPGRHNGWNVTLYKYDPKHVRDLSLVETPAEDNNWRLGIRSLARPVSMIVIDWQDKH